jgi:hypothetical protein
MPTKHHPCSRPRVRGSLRLIACVCLALACASGSAYAQSATSKLVGLVTDVSGAVVPDAKVTVTNAQTGISRATLTNSSGEYTVPFLDTGRYRITVEKSGFETFTLQQISLAYEQTVREDIGLRVGTSAQEVTVMASAGVLNTENATQNTVIDREKINDLPLSGRNFIQLAQLVPGVTPGLVTGNTGFTLQGYTISANGQRDFNNNYTLDGVNMTESRNPSPTFNPSIDALQEFNIQTGLYGAEYGTRAGAQVDLSLKSGTNQFHGDLYEFLRNSTFDSRNFFSPRVPALKQSQFGATFGGPIRKDRTFFFAAYDGTRQSAGLTQQGVVPTPAMFQGDFSAVAKPVINPATGAQFPGNIIPASLITPQAKLISSYYPAPDQGGVLNYGRVASSYDNDDQVFARLDQKVTEKNTLTGHVAYAKRQALSPAAVNPFGNVSPFVAVNVSVQDTHIFSPNIINQVQLGYNRYHREIDSQQQFPDVGQKLALPNTLQDPRFIGFPTVAMTGYLSVGEYVYAPLIFYNELKQVKDRLSFIHGNHSLKAGVDIMRIREEQIFVSYPRGQFGFTGYATGNPVADLLLGLPQTSGSSNVLVPGNFLTTFYHFFIADEWKVTRKLTLNVGIRYELDPPVQEQRGNARNFNGGPAWDGAPTGSLFPTGGTRTRLYGFDTKDFAPRFSFAYRPFGGSDTVIRAGYGIYYSMPEFNTVVDFNLNPPLSSYNTYTTSAQAPLSFNNPFPSTSQVAGAPTIYAVDPSRYRNGRSQLWTVSVGRRALSNMSFEAAYTGGRTDGMLVNALLNQPLPGPGAVQPRRPYPQYGNISYWVPDDYATYHALQLKAEKRLSGGFSFLASYTWSKAMDIQQSAIFGDAQGGSPQNKNNLRAEYGLASMDYRHRFVVSYGYELPFGTGKRFLSTASPVANALLGGWQMNGITTAQSGPPFTLFVPGDPAGLGGTGSLRPNRLRNGNLPSSDRTVGHWFDTSAFVDPPPYSFGNSGRNVLTGPGLFNCDLSLFKNFRITESKSVQFRAESFDLFNHPHFTIPGQTMDTTTLGVISSANQGADGRILQLALKLYF